jgi:hypothetical protein
MLFLRRMIKMATEKRFSSQGKKSFISALQHGAVDV